MNVAADNFSCERRITVYNARTDKIILYKVGRHSAIGSEMYAARKASSTSTGEMDIIKEIPAADVAEVVRCKDCKYGDYDSKPNGAMVCLKTNDGFWRQEMDFCSYGRRNE